MAIIAIDARIISSTTGRYVERLIHYLEEIDTKNTYLILVRKKDLSYYTPHNPNFRIVEANFADYSFGEQLGLARLLYKLKPDLVHFCMPQQPLLYTRTAITTVHDLNLLRITSNDMGAIELRIKQAVFSVLLKIVAKRTTRIITPTQYTKNDLVQFAHISPSKVTVTPEGASLAKATPTPMPQYKNVPFIMYLGRAEPYKNNRGLILAHQELIKTHPNLRLLIAGLIDELRTADKEWVREHGYKNVDFLGFTSDTNLAWLFANCRAYVFPSFMEGFGLPGLEAMSHGAPVASSNASCLPEVYGDAVVYFDPHNVHDIAQSIDRLITDDSLRAEFIAKGQAHVAKYSWQRMAEQTLEVYSSVLQGLLRQ